ncbi:Lysine exporter protein (LYSE/YGGA) [Rhodopseudomonas palustris HaA2]|uniref:Lysine exporter protein (LYSE/YGGA) n=1 Tax=Rhodopseudomonas palustris (strain HaA2) TaxID=316058 RepID=Q2IRF7_RHOP2|nr:LysE family translocator [Rhodopseudomonas palustris]ABD09203.1 Lysine exporter protein (LYSE/YGGA) [Rhodopseudomonas palustris HaA2]
MLGIHDFWLFVASGLLLNVTPGPDTAFILGRGLQFGWRGGAAAALGVSAGCLVHVTAAAVGLSALLMASTLAFTAVKLIGAAYLVWLGIGMLLSRATSFAAASDDAPTLRHAQVFRQGMLTNALNPKVALFFLAFLPQFVDAEAPHKALAFLVLGLIFVANGTLYCLALAAFAARASDRLRRSGRVLQWINRGLGALFVALGLRVALMQAR